MEEFEKSSRDGDQRCWSPKNEKPGRAVLRREEGYQKVTHPNEVKGSEIKKSLNNSVLARNVCRFLVWGLASYDDRPNELRANVKSQQKRTFE